MIPVRLQLHNFLSYGEAAEPLDFEQFRVACLSGGNGQGKSALLDAITWALWGEARKSPESRKPDEDLIRLGQREMRVELVFDLEGERYRVERSYQRSASGKSSKPGLEFQVWDAGAATFRPLTGVTVRETQERLDTHLGLNYETFINSAFLLQGRSDEFTRKKPTERKQILARILGLGRYDKLAAAAKGRYAEANERLSLVEAEVERLTHATADADALQEQRTEAAAALDDARARRDAALAEEAALTEALAALDARAREAQGLRDEAERVGAERAAAEQERAGLAQQIADAQRLIADADEIHARHERYERLYREREGLDEKSELRRGLETQAQTARLQIERLRLDAEKQLARLEATARADRDALLDLRRRLEARPRLEEQFAAAQQAATALEAEREKLAERRRLEERQQALDQRIASEQGSLNGQLQQLRLAAQQAETASPEALARDRAAARQRVAELDALADEQAGVRERGLEARSTLKAHETEHERLLAERAALEEKRRRAQQADTEDCPTCGTPLTESHRRRVASHYDRELERVAADVAASEARLSAARDEVHALREQYRAMDARLLDRPEATRALAALDERAARLDREAAEAATRTERIADLARRLETGDFAAELRAERTGVGEALDAMAFDQARFDRLQQAAAALPSVTASLRELTELGEREVELGRRLERTEREAADVRAGLDTGAAFAAPRRQLEVAQQQLDALGYDPARHDAVRRDLEALKQVPEQLHRLAAAQRSLADWTARHDRLVQSLADLDRRLEALGQQRAAAEEALTGRASVEARHRDARLQRADLDRRLAEAQGRLGGLDERLERLARDREALTAARARHREVRKERQLYGHLRTAFGKSGIPALIIEETLPEIEDRANEFLDRLSEGRVRVRLDTLKEKKTGGTRETLNINITDETGVPRAYETYSGGEAFRVNFALRLALAGLLAERSGVRVRTLVVDEGFGTQDKRGVEGLVSAIHAVQQDFDKILVITHLDELKEAFPVRIEVEKDAVVGSRYSLIGV